MRGTHAGVGLLCTVPTGLFVEVSGRVGDEDIWRRCISTGAHRRAKVVTSRETVDARRDISVYWYKYTGQSGTAGNLSSEHELKNKNNELQCKLP